MRLPFSRKDHRFPQAQGGFRIQRLIAGSFMAALMLAANAEAQRRPRGATGQGRRDATAAPAGGDTLTSDGVSRRYAVHDFSGGERAPLVILLHGGGGHAENMVEMTQFDVVARREKLIAVYPDGTPGPQGARLLTWNATHCCAAAMRDHVDDVGFIEAIIDRLVASGRADPARVYVTGMSNGAMMTHRLGRELSLKLAAIAPVVGAVFGDEQPPQAPVPTLIIVGEVDKMVPGAGGPVGEGLRQAVAPRGGLRGRVATRAIARSTPADRNVAPAVAAAEYWARANGCSRSTTVATTASTTTIYTECRDSAEVRVEIVQGSGHAWPGGKPGRAEADAPVQTLNASEEIWAFFKEHSRSR